jgi:hypothetical protein
MNLCVWFLLRLSQLILVLNGLLFVVVSAVMASGQERIAIFMKFPWGSFLTDLNNIMHLGVLDARSVWIAWLFLNAAITVSLVGRPRALALNPTHSHQYFARLAKRKAREIESDPDLKRSLKKLNQLLNKP